MQLLLHLHFLSVLSSLTAISLPMLIKLKSKVFDQSLLAQISFTY